MDLHVNESSCCKMDILDSDLDLLDICIASTDGSASEEEISALYFISGYVEKKFGTSLFVKEVTLGRESEFTDLVSRGKLCHPSDELFHFSRYAYRIFNLMTCESRCQCATYVCKIFHKLYECLPISLDRYNLRKIVRCFCNCFFKGLVNVDHSTSDTATNNSQRKLRKLQFD